MNVDKEILSVVTNIVGAWGLSDQQRLCALQDLMAGAWCPKAISDLVAAQASHEVGLDAARQLSEDC